VLILRQRGHGGDFAAMECGKGYLSFAVQRSKLACSAVFLTDSSGMDQGTDNNSDQAQFVEEIGDLPSISTVEVEEI
jgi:hypothetical protein